MKKINVFLFLLVLIFVSCSNTNEISQEEDQQYLLDMFAEIEALANSEQCINASEWLITAIGAKACGGPTGYIAYSNKIDTTFFLQKVKEYTTAQDEFNKKWNVVSDCSIPQEPLSVTCVEGSPIFVY